MSDGGTEWFRKERKKARDAAHGRGFEAEAEGAEAEVEIFGVRVAEDEQAGGVVSAGDGFDVAEQGAPEALMHRGGVNPEVFEVGVGGVEVHSGPSERCAIAEGDEGGRVADELG